MCHPIAAYRLSDSGPVTTAQLVDRICHERTGLEAWLRKFPADRLAVPSPGEGPSLCAQLQHVTAWRRVALDLLQGRLSPAAIPESPAFDFTCSPDLSAASVLNEFRAVHLDVLAEIALQPDGALAAPTGLPGLTMGDLIAALTCEHDRRHREEIARWFEGTGE